MWFGARLQTFPKRYSTWASCSFGLRKQRGKRGSCTVLGVKESQKQSFQEIMKSNINTPFLTSALYLRSPARKGSIKTLHSGSSYPLGKSGSSSMQRKGIWGFTLSSSWRPKYSGCSKHIQIKLQALVTAHFALRASPCKCFRLFFPKHITWKSILGSTIQVSSFHYYSCNTWISLHMVFLGHWGLSQLTNLLGISR